MVASVREIPRRERLRASGRSGTDAATLRAMGPPDPDRLYSKVTRRLMPWLFLGYIVAYLDRVNVSFAKLQMSEALAFSEAVYGLGAGIFFIGYFLFEVPSNVMLHRVGARIWLARIMVTWGVLSAAMMFVTAPTSFYVLRFLLGAAEAGFFPGVIYYLTQWYPASRRGRVTALFMTGIAVCSVIGSLLSGWILQAFDGLNGWAGWQWLFLLEALPAIVIGILLLFKLPATFQDASWLDAQEKQSLSEALAAESGSAVAGTSAAGTYGAVFRDGRVWFACLIYFCAVVGLYGIGFWLPTLVAEMGFDRPLHIGALAAIPYAIAGVGMVLMGRSADRRNERRWHVAVPAMLGALGLAASTMVPGQPFFILAALSVATFGILTVPPLFWALPTAYLRGASAAVGIAIINSFGNLAGFASPYFVGWMRDKTGSTDVALYGVAGFVLLAGVLVVAGVPSSAGSQDASQPSTS
jgi:D-galactonate transporter